MEMVVLVLILYWLFKSQIKAVVSKAGSVSSDAVDSILTVAGNASREARNDSLNDLRKLAASMGIVDADSKTQSQLAKEVDAILKA